MKPVLVLNVVGLTPDQIHAGTPNLQSLAARGAMAPMETVFPALTCSGQATYLTGLAPTEHGIVGNGWFFRDQGEVWLWRQSNALVQGEKVYETARALDPSFTCAKLFWWWNMGAAVDWSITPRPFYPADGRKILAVYGQPASFAAQTEAELGPFPFFDFWGPKSGLASSRWIAEAALRTLERESPTLALVYLPHLDYDHQRFGPDAPRSRAALVEVDELVGRLLARADERGYATLVLSEYGIEAADRPIHINRLLRDAGLLRVRETPVGETLDLFASDVFAVADHQVAHLYARSGRALVQALEALTDVEGIERVLDREDKRAMGIDHPRAGDAVLVAGRGAWFSYYHWLDDAAAPDFARTVDIHRKPGYDPCELFVDPSLRLPALRVARRLLQKKLGMRYLMDVIPLDASLVGGTHGRPPEQPGQGAVFLASTDFSRCGGDPAGGRVDPRSIPARILALLQR